MSLIFALDAGGDDSTDFLTVAGFASSDKDWEAFSQKWKARLDQDGIEFFHAKDAANYRGPFADWQERPDKEQLRRALFTDLMGLIQSHTYYKVACTVVNKEYQSTNSAMREAFVQTAYCLAARTCEKNARDWLMREWKSCPEIEVAFVFERGDKKQGKLLEVLKKERGHVPPNFRPKKDTPVDGGIEPGYVPLQAADWLAWELNSAERKFYPNKIESESQLRWPVRQFLGRPEGKLGIYSPENLEHMDRMIALQNELDAWATSLG